MIQAIKKEKNGEVLVRIKRVEISATWNIITSLFIHTL